MNVGLYNHNLELELHVVEGATPFLLSAKFLADLNASVAHITRARAITPPRSPAPNSSIPLGKFRPTAPPAHFTGPFPRTEFKHPCLCHTSPAHKRSHHNILQHQIPPSTSASSVRQPRSRTPPVLSPNLIQAPMSVPHITRAQAITPQHSRAPNSSIHLRKFRPTAPLAHSTGPFPAPNPSSYA